MEKQNENDIKTPSGTRRVLPIVVCSLLAVILLFGAVLGVITLVLELNAVVSYGGIRVDRGVAAYLASTFKAAYGADKDDADLDAATEEYIRGIVTAAYLFDRNASLTDDDRKWITENTAEILDYRAENSVQRFNEMSEGMGFTYDDFCRATELLYKASSAKESIYGVGGSKLAYAANSDMCTEYFAKYSHVKIIFIRTKDRFVLDEDGNRVKGDDGNDLTVDLSDLEEEAVRADIDEIRALVNAANSGGNEQMSLATFNGYYKKYNDDPDNAEDGYYFAPTSAYTAEFAEEYPNLVSSAFSLSVGDYGIAEDGNTVAVLYRIGNVSHDYISSSKAHFFGDFYSDAADYLFLKALGEIIGEVNVKDEYHALDLASLKKNSYFKTQIGIGFYLD